ncbi:MAG: hypothetical protein A2017_05525 [Lentisphaerae bacterium GWF2_44_16]|nr:MAG: hypothetical protein A2017_05525 [Lentisphaerae bacterium GWF2_44_16]
MIINSAIISKDDMAYEGRTFKPDGKTLWLRETYMPVNETPAADNTPQKSVIMRYDVFVPAASGTEIVEDFAESFKALFDPEKNPILYDDIQIVISTAESLNARPEPKWYSIPVQIKLNAWQI